MVWKFARITFSNIHFKIETALKPMDSFKGVTHEDIYSMKNSRYDVFYKVLFHLQISTNFNACKNLVENFLKEKPSISLKSAFSSGVCCCLILSQFLQRRIQKEEESLNNNKTNDYDFLIHFSDTQSPRVVAGQPDGQRNLPRVSKQEIISF